MTDLCETFDQFWIQLCLELNLIKTNFIFVSAEESSQYDQGGIGKCQKVRSIT